MILDAEAFVQSPLRGDWYFTNGMKARSVCKEYTAPPDVVGPDGKALGQCLGLLPRNHWIGPVHDVVHFEGFVSVRVPSWHMPGTLVWVNVEKNGSKFAQRNRTWAGFLD